nr:MAG: hypothetical protein 1 [Hangzhou tombus-like virus 1]
MFPSRETMRDNLITAAMTTFNLTEIQRLTRDYFTDIPETFSFLYNITEDYVADVPSAFGLVSRLALNGTSILANTLGNAAEELVKYSWESLKNFTRDVAIPQNPAYEHNLIIFILLTSFLFVLSVALVVYTCYQENTPEEPILMDAIVTQENEAEIEEMEEVIQDVEVIELGMQLANRTEMNTSETLRMNALKDRYKELLARWTDLSETRDRVGVVVEYDVLTSADYWKTRLFLMLVVLVLVTLASFHLRQLPDSNFAGSVLSWLFEGTMRGVCEHGYSEWDLWVLKMTGSKPLICTPFDRGLIYLLDLEAQTVYFHEMFLSSVISYRNYIALSYGIDVIVCLILIFFTIPGRVHFRIDVSHTPVNIDMRPDEMRLLNIRHKDPMMSEVTETRNWVLLIKHLFAIERSVKFVISYELFCQLSAPNHWAYGMEEDNVVEKMSHSAQYFSTINFDRHIYHHTSAFENTVRAAKYRHKSRVLAGMPNF